MPSLFVIHNTIWEGKAQRIKEDLNSIFEGYAMFAQISSILPFIPLELDACHYIIVVTNLPLPI